MSIDAILSALQQSPRSLDRSLILPADTEFASTLTLGQVIKGRVLRQVDTHRYAVAFGSQEKVVDSTIPLRSGELIHGKVTALDDYVHLRRIYPNESQAVQRSADAINGLAQHAHADKEVLTELLQQYRAALYPDEQNLLQRLSVSLPNPKLLAMSGLVLNKLGLRMTPELVRALYLVISNGKLLPEATESKTSPKLEVASATDQLLDKSVVTGLSAFLSFLSKQQAEQIQLGTHALQNKGLPGQHSTDKTIPDASLSSGQHSQQGDDAYRHLGQQLLNVQNESSVAHRLINVPLWFGDRLVEIQLALFSQREGVAVEPDSPRYRKLAFSLDTEVLGHIDVVAHVVEHRLKLLVTATSHKATDFISGYLRDLQMVLRDYGWHLDEIDYQVSSGAPSNALFSVVEHHITPDSLSCLI